jgi:hypothetical protein
MKSNPHLFLHAVFALVFTTVLCCSNIAHASHVAGADLTYQHLSGNLYRIRCTFYRDCFGIAAPGTIDLNVSSVSCGVNQMYSMIPIPVTGQDIILICPGETSTCVGGSVLGMQKWEYEVDVPLQGQCADWTFSISIAARSAAITTLQNPNAANLYVEAHLNNQNSDNSSPAFTNDPLIYVNTGQDFHYNNGAYDIDGDSLAYYLVCPLNAPNVCVLYAPGYSALQPFLSNPPVTFDNFTGDYFMHPTISEVGVIAYKIFDYRNGELMGSVTRDIILYTTPDANNNPTATGMDGTSQQFDYVFPNDTICFDILSDDVDAADSLSMSWNQVIPGATFTTTSGLHPTGTFCWTPDLNNVRSQPYMFTALIHDENCAINDAGVYSYFIYVTLDSSLVLNTSNPSDQINISIYPNPSDGNFTIDQVENISFLKIYDAGKLIQTIKPDRNQFFLDAVTGVYCIEIIFKDGKSRKQKLLLKK